MNFHKFFHWIACCVLLADTHQLSAQVRLGSDESRTISTLISSDLIIPSTEMLSISMRAGDGGKVRFRGVCNTEIKGGAGAGAQVTFKVNAAGDALRPGGILRVFVGQRGGNREPLCSNSGQVSGAGGGASAVLYLPPGDDPNGFSWRILAVAGGGGGAARPIAGKFLVGKGGRADKEGGSAGGKSGGSDSSGCPEEVGLAASRPGLGGSLSCDSWKFDRYGKSMFTGNAVGSGLAPTIALKPSSSAQSTGGTASGHPDGGDGFSGGGVAGQGGGGGGGFYGGAAAVNYAGGGGGSYVAQGVYSAINGKTIAGVDGNGSSRNGFVTITTNSSPSYLATKTIYPATQNVALLLADDFKLVWQQDGNLVLKEKDGSGKYTARWASNTAGRGDQFNFQKDGNLVIYSSTKQPIWSTDTWANNYTGRKGGHWLFLSPQGKLSILADDDTPLWSVEKFSAVGE